MSRGDLPRWGRWDPSYPASKALKGWGGVFLGTAVLQLVRLTLSGFLLVSSAVGLPRYQHHPSPVCDRKDFVLNFNGISSFHPSAGGSYYHPHHHQSVCQDIKPCVM